MPHVINWLYKQFCQWQSDINPHAYLMQMFVLKIKDGFCAYTHTFYIHTHKYRYPGIGWEVALMEKNVLKVTVF